MEYKERDYKCTKCHKITKWTANHNSHWRRCKHCNDPYAYLVCTEDGCLEKYNAFVKERDEHRAKLPVSTLCPTSQKRKFSKTIIFDGFKHYFDVEVRWDDECHNNHNSFAITGSIYKYSSRSDSSCIMVGCLHNEIQKYFPKLKHLIDWHHFTSDGYDFRGANIIYLAKQGDLESARRLARWYDAWLRRLT